MLYSCAPTTSRRITVDCVAPKFDFVQATLPDKSCEKSRYNSDGRQLIAVKAFEDVLLNGNVVFAVVVCDIEPYAPKSKNKREQQFWNGLLCQ
jgi:hypothetical protein